MLIVTTQFVHPTVASTLDPVARKAPDEKPPPPPPAEGEAPPAPPDASGATTVLFAKNAPVLVVGDAAGAVACYRVKGLPEPPVGLEAQVEQLKAAFLVENA